jgi:3-deoxy-D-manno-octulosonic acid kinase
VSGRRYALGPEVKRSAVAGGAMLYDTSRVGNLNNDWFEPRFWQARGELDGRACGRGTTYFVKADGRAFVLRHYRRGGLVAQLFGDRYRWRDESSTRPFAEWQLTYRLHRAGLPVPAPLAARYRHQGSTYTGDLITERLPTVGSLTECLRTGALSIVTWISIGRCIRRFHESVYLIDFDRCQLRKPGIWRDGNLVRLRRSLEKVTWGMPPERFTESDWHGLLDGYRQSSGKTELPP